MYFTTDLIEGIHKGEWPEVKELKVCVQRMNSVIIAIFHQNIWFISVLYSVHCANVWNGNFQILPPFYFVNLFQSFFVCFVF